MSQVREARRPTIVAAARARVLDHPLANYHLLLGGTLLLLILGLVMVTSASSVESYKTTGSSFTLAQRQIMFAVFGVVLMLIASRTPVPVLRRLAWPALILSFVLLLLVFVPHIGVTVNGQRNWITLFGPYRLQPSEFAKLGLVLWGADLLARKKPLLTTWRHLLIPLVPVGFGIVGLVVLEKDLGTAMILVPILCALLYAAGAPLRLFVGIGVAGLAGVAMLSLTAAYRVERFRSWLDPESDKLGAGFQLLAARDAFGVGGLWGGGLGASREKWGSLPEAHTDFIFAVVGEELGLAGTLIILTLFAVLIAAALRLARDTADDFVRIATTGVAVWIGVQAMLNLGAVLGLLPITGVPLPLVSYGGSSLLPTLLALGVLMAFARQEPAAARVLAARTRGRSAAGRVRSRGRRATGG